MTTKETKSETRRTSALMTWIWENHAKQLWTQDVNGVGNLTGYAVNGRVVLVMIHANGHGWEMFIPASDTNSVADTLEAASRFVTN